MAQSPSPLNTPLYPRLRTPVLCSFLSRLIYCHKEKLSAENGKFVYVDECCVTSIYARTEFSKNELSPQIFEKTFKILALNQRISKHFEV